MRFTIRPKPLVGESLTSYLLRLSNINSVDFFDLFKFLFQEDSSTRFRTQRIHFIDILPNRIIKCKELSQLIALSVEEINKMTFTPVISKYIDSRNIEEERLYMTMILKQIDGRNRRFCPNCLKEKRYYKLIWQVKEIEICNIHHVKLQTSCKICNNKHLYLHKKTAICNHCYSNLDCGFEEIDINQDYIDRQMRKYREWEFLFSFKALSPIYGGIPKDKAISLNLLYISQLKEKEFKSTKNRVFSTAMTNALKMFIHEKDYKKVQRPYLPLIFKVISHQDINICISEFASVKVPNTYINSVYNQYKDNTLGPCLTPWCENYNSNKMMQTTDVLYKNYTRYRFASVCTGCFIKFGYNRIDGNWEEIGINIERIKKVIKLFNKGFSCLKVRGVYKFGMENIYEIYGYALYHRLLSEEELYKHNFNIKSNNVKECFVELTNFGTNKVKLLRKAKQLFNWTIVQYYYYLAFPEVQRYLLFESKLDKSKEYKKVQDNIRKKTNPYIVDNRKISITSVADELSLNRGSLSRWGVKKLISEARDEQTKKNEKEIWECVKKFVHQKRKKQELFTYTDISNYTGYNRQQLANSHYKIHKYIIHELKIEKQNEYNRARKRFLQDVIATRNYLRENHKKSTLQETANYLGVSKQKINYHLVKEGIKWGNLDQLTIEE